MSLALAPRRGVSMLGLIMPIWGPKPFPQVSPWHLLKGVRANARPMPPLLKLCGELPLWPLPLLCLPPSPLRLRRPPTGPVVVSPVTGQAAGDAKTRERTRSPPPSKEASSQPALPRPAMPHAASFSPLETGGEGDCAYTSVATGLAQMSGTDATEADLKPGGRLQGYLRCEAAKWIRGHPDLYGGSEAAARFATRVATTGVWADTPSLYALARALKVQLRVYSFAPTANLWKLYIIGDVPTPNKGRDGKAKKGSQPSVLWLEHADQHYRWLKPKGPDTVLDKAVTSTATTVDASSMPMPDVGRLPHLAAFSASEARPRLKSAVLESSLVWELPLPPRQLPQSCWALPLRARTTWTTPLASFTTAPVAGLCPLACEATAQTLLLWHTGDSARARALRRPPRRTCVGVSP